MLAAQGLTLRRYPFVIQTCKALHRRELDVANLGPCPLLLLNSPLP
jgi:hypothetical protein